MDAGTNATIWAAIATAVSAATIAWQSLETRKSAGAAERAASASEQALEVANESLEISRNQSRLGQFTALEALRARLAERAPALTAEIDPKPIGYAIGESSEESEYRLIDIGTIVQVPQQESHWLYAVYNIWFSNHGTEPVTITAHPGFFNRRENNLVKIRDEYIVVAPNENEGRFILIGTNVGRWTYMLEHNRHGIIGEGGWSTTPQTSQGVALSQEIKIVGPIIRPEGAGNWSVKGVGEDINYGSRLETKKIDMLFFSSEGYALPEIDPWSIAGETP